MVFKIMGIQIQEGYSIIKRIEIDNDLKNKY